MYDTRIGMIQGYLRNYLEYRMMDKEERDRLALTICARLVQNEQQIDQQNVDREYLNM